MEFRRLRYFTTVAEELHFGRAAERLHMAQQPLSAQIRELEREIGYDLFERYANRIRLTPAGDVFLGEARAILARSESAVELTRRAARGEAGTVRIGYCSAAMEHVLPALIRALQASYLGIGLELRELSHGEQLRALERDELDLGFVYRPFDDRAFAARDLFEERIVAAMSVDHPLAHARSIAVDRLTQERLVLFSSVCHPAITAIGDDVRRAGPAATPPAFTASDRATAIGLAAHGLGIALIPENAALARADVAYVALDSPERLQFAAVWSKHAPQRVIRQRVLDAIGPVAPTGALLATV